MLKFSIRRLVLLVPILFGLSLLVFIIGRVIPGDPVALAAGPNASRAQIVALTHELGFDKPVYVQYVNYLSGLLHGNWGQSIFTRRPVLSDLAVYLPATLEIVLAAMFLAIVIGVPAGLAAAVHRNKWPDYLARAGALSAISTPQFFFGLLLQLLFAMTLSWLPLSGRFPLTIDPPRPVTGLLTIDSLIAGDVHAFGIALIHLALPAVTACLTPLASITRMMRTATIEVLQQDYVTTARALGVSPRIILWKYVLKNALSTTLTVVGLYFGWLLGGTVLVETVFDWPGIGQYAAKAIVMHDFTPVMGVTLTIGVLVVLTSLFVDLLYGVINPKVRYQ
ncbi:ABC transporter permease [Trinickia sp.]|uniref:ABC transporter permease n=1 Tax=Trinickia sp. TaxID=2571163 RepID=UPI003F819D4F